MKKLYTFNFFIITLWLFMPGSMVWAQSPIFYGMTYQGGSENLGTIIRFSPANDSESVLWNFDGDGVTEESPIGNFVYYPNNGLLYGAVNGDIISLNPVTNKRTICASVGIPGDFGGFNDYLAYDPVNGLFYTFLNPGVMGSIVTFNPINNQLNTVWNFGVKPNDSLYPDGNLTYCPFNGLFYAMTNSGTGKYAAGAIISFDPNANRDSALWAFGGEDGNPVGSLVYDPDNAMLYGMSSLDGAIISFNPATNIESIVSGLGGNPTGDLVYDSGKGIFYGMAPDFFTYDGGDIFSFNPNTNNVTSLWSFKGGPSDGAHPFANLVYNAANGLYYGMTSAGGTDSLGTIFSFNPQSNSESVVWNFKNGGDGSYPNSSLLAYIPTLSNITISAGPVASNHCPGDSISVPYYVIGNVNPGNVFTVELSDPNGNFTSYTVIGSAASTDTLGMINAVIPINAVAGTGYSIRVVSSNPAPYSSNYNGSTITIYSSAAPLVSVTDSPGGPVCPGTEILFTAHPTNGGFAPSYQWKKDGDDYGTNSPTINFSSSNLGPFDSVWVVMTSNPACGATANAVSNKLGVVLKTGTTISVNSVSICSGQAGTLNATGATTYTWTPSTGLSATTGGTVTANPTTTTTYTVMGTSNCGSTAAKAVVTVNSTPSVATAVAGTAASATQLTANWNTISGATGYYVDVSLHNNFSSFVTGYNNLSVGNVTSQAVTGLTPGTTYYYRVRAGSSCGAGANSNTITYATTTCAALTAGTISPASAIICPDTTQLLTLNGASGGNLQWQISADNVNWNNVASGGNSGTYITRPADGTSNKYYRCVSSNACYNAASTLAVVDVSTPNITITPSNITDNSATLSWSPAGAGNYAVSYSGASNGLQTSITPPKTLLSLAAGSNYSVTVTQTSPAACHATGTISVTTLCAAPTNLKITATTSNTISVSWTGVAGNYKVYYTQLFSSTHTTQTLSVTNAITATLSSLLAGATYQIYVVSQNCGSTAGQSSGYVTGTTTTTPACSGQPVIDSVRTTCSSELEVWVHGSATNQYKIYLQAIAPVMQAANTYTINGGTFSVNVAAGQTFLIGAASVCSAGVSQLRVWPQPLVVPAACGAVSNLLLSDASCVGFTATWNADNCTSSTLASYTLSIRKQGAISWSSYSILPVSPLKVVNWLAPGITYQCFVRSAYNCGSYLVYGPSSQTARITTLSNGCRIEDEQDTSVEANAPAVSAGNDEESFSLYPNPNTGEFTVDFSRLNLNTEEVRIEVMNLLGQTALTHITSISGGHLNEFIQMPAGCASGIYFVRLTAGDKIYNSEVNVSR